MIIGKIINRHKQLVKDSYKTKQWLYLLSGKSKNQGVRILASGYFAIPAYDINKEVGFYFIDKYGGYIEHRDQFNKKEAKEYLFDLSDTSKTFVINLPNKRKKIIQWRKSKREQWRLYDYPLDKKGTIALLLGKGDYVFSTTNSIDKPKYLLKVDNNNSSGQFSLTHLPMYLDPKSLHVYGQVNDKEGKPLLCNVHISAADGSYYPPVTTNPKGKYSYLVQKPKYNLINFVAYGVLAIKQVDFSKSKHNQVNVDLSKDTFSKIISKRKQSKIFFNKKEGRGFRSFAKGYTNKKGILLILLPAGTYYVSVGRNFSDDMKEITIKENESITIDLK